MDEAGRVALVVDAVGLEGGVGVVIERMLRLAADHDAVALVKLHPHHAVDHFDVYWLTTHCMDGTTEHAVEYLNRASPEDLRQWLEQFKPVKWSLKKTEAIDFTKPFLWFDDDCFTGEKIDLQQHNALNSWIEIDLRKTPDQMKKELATLEAFVDTE